MLIRVPTEEGEAIIAVQYIVSIQDLKRTEQNPDRGASIYYQVGNEMYHTYTTLRAKDVEKILIQLAGAS